jgi:hypothetical protein
MGKSKKPLFDKAVDEPAIDEPLVFIVICSFTDQGGVFNNGFSFDSEASVGWNFSLMRRTEQDSVSSATSLKAKVEKRRKVEDDARAMAPSQALEEPAADNVTEPQEEDSDEGFSISSHLTL